MLRKASVTWSSRASLRSQGVSIRADWTLDPQQARTSRRFVRVRAGPPRAMPASASFCGPAWPPPRALTPPRLTRTASVQNHADAQICPCLETHRAAGARGDPRPCSPCPSRLRVVARALRPGLPGRTRPPFSSLARRVAFPSSPRPAPRARGGAGGRALPDRPSRLSLKGVCGRVDAGHPHSPGPAAGTPGQPVRRRPQESLRRGGAGTVSTKRSFAPPCLPLQGTRGGRRASRVLWLPASPVPRGEGPWPSPWAMARAQPPPAAVRPGRGEACGARAPRSLSVCVTLRAQRWGCALLF